MTPDKWPTDPRSVRQLPQQPDQRVLRQQATLESLRSMRWSWWQHWGMLADYILPRRYRWLVTPNQWNRGSPINRQILDATGTIAARTLASGMMSGITSPTRPWFKLGIDGYHTEADVNSPVSIWLTEVQTRMMRVMAESNFYNAIATVYSDLGVFGTACMLIYEDYDDVIRCYNPCAGEYFFANNSKLRVDTVYREFIFTAQQVVDEFGRANCPQEVLNALTASGKQTQEFTIIHSIEPEGRKWKECYSIKGLPFYLRETQFEEFPALTPRWDLVSNDAYGRSPGMEALGDIMQLQQETKRKGQAIDKMVNPPMLADVELQNRPATILPGGVTYVSRTGEGQGMRPVFTLTPPINELKEDIREIQDRIRRIFFNDLFMMFQDLQAEPRSAAAVDARREEKMVLMGPVLERFENEALDPAIRRIFGIMSRGGLLPPPPPEIQGEYITMSYRSMLAESQKAVAATSIERVLALAGNMAAVFPGIADKINDQEAMDQYSGLLGVPPTVMRSDEEVAAIQRQKQEAAAQQEAAAMAPVAADSAKVLSETDVGGGQSALAAMMGNA